MSLILHSNPSRFNGVHSLNLYRSFERHSQQEGRSSPRWLEYSTHHNHNQITVSTTPSSLTVTTRPHNGQIIQSEDMLNDYDGPEDGEIYYYNDLDSNDNEVRVEAERTSDVYTAVDSASSPIPYIERNEENDIAIDLQGSSNPNIRLSENSTPRTSLYTISQESTFSDSDRYNTISLPEHVEATPTHVPTTDSNYLQHTNIPENSELLRPNAHSIQIKERECYENFPFQYKVSDIDMISFVTIFCSSFAQTESHSS